MTEEQIKLNAEEYADKKFPSGDKVEILRAKLAYMAGAQSRNIDEMFESLDPYQKAEFMQRNMEWVRNCDLVNELKIRNL